MTKLPTSLTRVTLFSKLIALFVITGLLVSAFYAGFLFNQRYGSSLATITPTPTPIANVATACTQDTDCTLVASDVGANCCSNTKCLSFADSNTVAASTIWVKGEFDRKCGRKIMCPMIAVMCTRSIVEENAHYSAKCINNVCTKVRG